MKKAFALEKKKRGIGSEDYGPWIAHVRTRCITSGICTLMRLCSRKHRSYEKGFARWRNIGLFKRDTGSGRPSV
jgi:hypothetical protein